VVSDANEVKNVWQKGGEVISSMKPRRPRASGKHERWSANPISGSVTQRKGKKGEEAVEKERGT